MFPNGRSSQDSEGAATMRFRDLRTTAEIASIYRFPSREACRKWLVRHRVPHVRRGRILLVDTRDVEKAFSEAWTDRTTVRLLA